MSDKPEHEANRLITYCPECDDKQECHVDGEYVDYADTGVWIHRLIHCAKCCSAMLIVQEPLPDGDESEPARLYPPTRVSLGPEVPSEINRYLREAVACFELAKGYTATALMCRRVVETVAADLGQKGKYDKLALVLKKLFDAGVLDKAIYDWATELRALGNDAAHGDKVKISRADAEDALRFTEALLSYVYTYREQFKQYKIRRAATA